MTGTVLLVVAKAPVPGQAKTRLTPPATPQQAAAIAAACLLDTLRTVRAVPRGIPAVALTGRMDQACRGRELCAELAGMTVLAQRGESFADRLAAAHADTAEAVPGHPVLQIGMDTPQVTAELLTECAAVLHRPQCPDAVLGPATDGGWWALGVLNTRHAAVLRAVPMSQPDTGERTLAALRAAGLRVDLLPELTDVDDMAQARQVATQLPGSEFAAAVAAVDQVPAAAPGSAFDGALRDGLRCLHHDDGRYQTLSVTRWHGLPDSGDELMLARCRGATLDVGCGPGRLTGALRARGAIALGIDISPRAVRMTTLRGGVALRRDVFGPIPGQGRWDHVLLADGNIGIGGDPRRLLHRVRQLLRRAGSAIVEVEPPGIGLHQGLARIGTGPMFPWARVGVEAVASLSAAVGFRLVWSAGLAQRWFVELVSP